LETLIKKRKVEGLMNLIYVSYTIGNFDQKMLIPVIFSESAHLCKSKKKNYTILVKFPNKIY